MEVVCAWCGTALSPVAGGLHGSLHVSHGICGQCRHVLTADLDGPLERFLDSLLLPVLVMDADGSACTANEQACDLIGFDRDAVLGRRAGDLFACVNAALPGGCGRQDKCSTCTIRESLEFTIETGLPTRRETHYPDRGDHGPRRPVTIATVKAGALVLLRVEELSAVPT